VPTRKQIRRLGLGALLLAAPIVFWMLKREGLDRVENQTLRHPTGALESEIGGQSSRSPNLRLPEPEIDLNAAPAEVASSWNRVNVLAPFHIPNLTAVQAAAFVQENQGSAASLLAAFRTAQDATYLMEAMQKYPNDPQVALEALFKAGLSSAERRPWIEALKKSAPDNPLGNYLSARDYFNSGQNDLAVEELAAASGKTQFSDLTLERMQMDEEAYRFSGLSEKDSKAAAMFRLELPQLKDMPDLAKSMIELSKNYRQSGDAASADAVVETAVNLGEQFRNSEKSLLVNQMLGIGIEVSALESLDPSAAFGSEGGTVRERLDALKATNAEMSNLVRQTVPLQDQMSTQDWVGYMDRMKLFGEQNAMRWLLAKRGTE
jgi:hypothetical protein